MIELLDVEEMVMGPESAGLFMTPEEFDAVHQFDENYRYELIHGVVIVSPIPLPHQTSPNDLLGHMLLTYQENDPHGKALDATLPQQYVRTSSGRRLADRLFWAGLGHYPRLDKDVANIAVELVSGSRRDRKRDYSEKRVEYMEAGIGEYWIIDRFERTMTVIVKQADGEREIVIRENETYESPLLPGFRVALARLLAAADQCDAYEQ